MQYKAGETTVVTFDADDEAQALTWAAGDMHRADTDDPVVLSAFESAREAYRDTVSKREGITLEGSKADAMISILKRWVEAGPPRPEGQGTDAARAKSYRTACAIVAKTVEVPDL
ncbi:MAG: hypothetical protein JWM52_176 [Candidatus Saccharibacteria bacterium]|nr:hypothetical protein [Candidatus Saccharibacteria bacterium]